MANIMHDYYLFGAEVPSRIYEVAAREFDEEEYTNIYMYEMKGRIGIVLLVLSLPY